MTGSSSQSEALCQRNNIQISGAGDSTILFAHGFGCDQSVWRFIEPSFEADYRIVKLDLVGSGQSDLSAFDVEKYSRLEGYAQDILDIIDALSLEPVIMVGHSVSAMIGAIAAIQQPDKFSRLVMVAPSPCYINHPPEYVGGFDRQDIEELLALMDRNYMAWASFLAPVVMQNADRPDLAQDLTASFCSTDPVTARTFAKATFYSDYRDELSKVSIPCLIMQCLSDPVAPVEVGEFMRQQLPVAQLAAMNATGHCPHISHPTETSNIIRAYLNQSPNEAVIP